MTLDDLTAAFAIRLWLPVKLSDGRSDTLYTKTIRTVHTPRDGDRIELWPETDDISGAMWTVKDTHWNADGLYNVEFAAFVVDPDEAQLDRMRRAGRDLYQGMPWYSAGYNGPLDHDQLLTDAGWTEWGGS